MKGDENEIYPDYDHEDFDPDNDDSIPEDEHALIDDFLTSIVNSAESANKVDQIDL